MVRTIEKLKQRVISSFMTACILLSLVLPAAASAEPTKATTFLTRQEAAINQAQRFGIRALGVVIKQIDGCLAGVTMEELLADSAVIATGKITGGPHSFVVEHASVPGLTAYYSEYDFTIDTVWKGRPYAETVSVRIPGGVVDGVGERYSGTPQFNQEDEYLLFLVTENHGGGYSTRDDYYRPHGLVQGVYIQDEEGVYHNTASDEELPGEAMISPHLDEVREEGQDREELLDDFRQRYEEGNISQEEYEELLDQLDQYATVVKRAS